MARGGRLQLSGLAGAPKWTDAVKLDTDCDLSLAKPLQELHAGRHTAAWVVVLVEF